MANHKKHFSLNDYNDVQLLGTSKYRGVDVSRCNHFGVYYTTDITGGRFTKPMALEKEIDILLDRAGITTYTDELWDEYLAEMEGEDEGEDDEA